MIDIAPDPAIIPIGTPVVALNGAVLGNVREVHSHYLLVGEAEQPHYDFDVPTRAIARFESGRLYLKVNREALTEVDDTESANRRGPIA